MPFEAFLSESHTRPPRASRWGFVASIAMHGPPITLFVATWLSHAALIGTPGIFPEAQLTRAAYYVPLSLYGHGAGSDGTDAEPGASGGEKGSRSRLGLLGRSGRAGRRGLVAPRVVKPLPKKAAWEDPFMSGIYASTDTAGDPGSHSGRGDDQPGSGQGSGSEGQGRGGRGGAGPGNALLAATTLDRSKEKEREKEKKAKLSHGRRESNDQVPPGEDDHEIGTDLDVVLDDGRAVRAAYISQDTAAYYRTEDSSFPRLHETYWPAGRREWAMLFRICVSTEGTVSNVMVLKSASVDIDRLVSAAINSWRYRPHLVDGVARPFCHPIRIVYAR